MKNLRKETMNKLSKIAIGIALSSAMFAGQTMAAQQGTLGATSTGKSTVTLEIADMVKITGVDDIGLGAFDGINDLSGGTAFCVYRSGGNGYRMTVSAEGKTALEVESASTTDTIGFTAKVDNDSDASNGTAIVHNGTSGTYSGSSALDCGASDNASLAVNFAAADLLSASAAADYTATVVILVEPI
jgi:hypothetical protein